MLLKLAAFYLSVASFVLIQEAEGLKCFNGTQVIEGKTKPVPITEVECKASILVCAFAYEAISFPKTPLSDAYESKIVTRSCANQESSNALNGTCEKRKAGAEISIAYCAEEKCNTFATYNNICKADLKEPVGGGEMAIHSSISLSALALCFVVVLGVGDKGIGQTSSY